MNEPMNRPSPSNSLFDLWITQLWQIRAVLARAATITMLGTALTLLLSPRDYGSDFSVLPQPEASASQLGGLAAQLGVSLAGAAGGYSPDFYAELARSRRILSAIVANPVPVEIVEGDTTWTMLSDALRITAPNAPVRRVKTLAALGERVGARAALKTGVVRVSVRLPEPAMAHFVARRILQEVHIFNDSSRQARALAEVQFLETRLAQASADVAEMEERTERFLQLNRQYEQSPSLKFAFERLQRELTVRLELQRELRVRLQQSRVESARNTPLLTTVERPERPARAMRKFMAVKSVAAAAAVVALIALLVAFVLEFEGAAWFRPSAVSGLRRAVGLPQHPEE